MSLTLIGNKKPFCSESKIKKQVDRNEESNTKPGKKHERQNTNPPATKTFFLVEYATNFNEAEIPFIKYPIMEDQMLRYRISRIYNVVLDR